MAPLASNLRRDLERAIIEARKTAERGARSALGALTVPDTKAGRHLDVSGRDLRNRLRAHARQLGDKRSGKGEQAIDRLVRECAYEHWHRMLFARFLAENDLLIEPESGVSVSLDDVEELAREQGAKPWPLAASYAQHMLPQIFRADDPVLAIDLPTETGLKLESLLENLSRNVFTADDSLGWTYQFWQAAEKDAVNDRVKSGEKITGETLPAVTQLFTEHYMVLFLLHNTIGAWHAGKVIAARPEVASTATNEQELRDAVRLSAQGGYDFEYLRFVREAQEGDEDDSPTGAWRPAAGVYDGWPAATADLRVLDPCCGSGHFLVAAFDLLVRLRMTEEGIATDDAIRSVLANNVFGLELDARCTQIAAFNLALAAWKTADSSITLPQVHIACCGIGPQSTKEEWLTMADSALLREEPQVRETIRRGLIHMHELFSEAPELGSLIDPNRLPTEGFAADYETLHPFLTDILNAETNDADAHERAVAARGMADAAEILAGSKAGYTLVVTNVPYLGRKTHSPSLIALADADHGDAKHDLATLFLSRALMWTHPAGTTAIVTPQNWLFISSYRKFRERLLTSSQWHLVARLGENSFESTAAAGAFASLQIMSSCKAPRHQQIAMLDAGATREQEAIPASVKAEILKGTSSLRIDRTLILIEQAQQRTNPDSRVTFCVQSTSHLLSDDTHVYSGIQSGDDPRFRRSLWELPWNSEGWEPLQTAPMATHAVGGMSSVFFWQDGAGDYYEYVCARLGEAGVAAWIRGLDARGRAGIVVSRMAKLPALHFHGTLFDQSCAAIIPNAAELLAPIWAYCSSQEYSAAVRVIDQKLNVTTRTLVKVPFDLDQWSQQAEVLPDPHSDDPCQWFFHGHPACTELAATLQVGVARLLGYRWPAESDADLRLADQTRLLVSRCAELHAFTDDDGIVCLSALRGEWSAGDRLRRLLAAAFGDAWSVSKERELLQAAADRFNTGAVAGSLDEWLRDRFFVEHCKLFQHRPFVWHIWDGKKDGFHALVNYHKLSGPEGEGRRTLEALTYSYLGDWIRRQEDAVKTGDAGAEARLAAAMELRSELDQILAGEPPYDIFVRWKPLHEQAIGWAPNINDGVRLNIRPFMSATLSKGRKGAGLLRWKPNIKWGKDRGKEPQSLRPHDEYPWFWSWDEDTRDFAGASNYDGSRWNALHFTCALKERVRTARSCDA